MRLTEKYDDNSGYGVIEKEPQERHLYIDFCACDNCVQKLGQLEDIEDELGIDLITLFKALKNGVYVKETNGKIKYYNPDQIAVNLVGNYPEIVFLNTAKNGDYCALNTKAYKLPYLPTWALTREELI